MGGFASVLRRITMATFAFGLAFGVPNLALAQAPKFQPTRLPWQTRTIFTEAISFDTYDNGWARVLSDTRRLLRRFAPRSALQNKLGINATARAAASRAFWAYNIHTYAPLPPKPPQVNIGTVRTTFTPIEFSSKTVAESRANESVLAGVQFQLLK